MTMDSDSESQDSDDGRRFRFEATRKDDAAQGRRLQGSSSKSSKHKASRYTDDLDVSKRDGNYRESRDKQNDGNRSSKVKEDCKHFAKHSKHSHESRWHSKKRSRDKSRDSRRYRDRDRLRKDRSRDRDNDNKSPIDKQKHKSRERYRHHSRNRSRDISQQCNKLKLLDSGKSQDELDKYESSKKSCENDTKIDSSLDDQGCKQIDLSDFDVLSETHETSSNASDVANQNMIDENESSLKKQNLEQCCKVNVKIDDQLSGSSNNNSSTISDPISSVLKQNTEYENLKDREDNICKRTHIQDHKSISNDPNLMSIERDEESSLEADDFVYGPSLPPTLKSHSNSSNDINALCDDIGSKKHFIGPCLPQNNKENVRRDSKNEPSSSDEHYELESTTDDQRFKENTEDAEEDVTFGPVLPPHLQQNKSENVSQDKLIGPIGPLPSSNSGSMKKDELVQNHSESDDEDGIGPLPSDHPALRDNIVHEQLERRAIGILNEFKEEIESDSSKREEWMMELPPAQVADLGLGPRKFRMRAAPDMSDRSCWTDTPAMKAKKEKEKEKERAEKKMMCSRELNEMSVRESKREEKKSRKREKSLLELHQEKLAKRKKKEEKELGPEKPTRRPFDRDVDLQANRFDQIQKKAILKKAQMLNDRFCKGKI